MNLYTKIRNQIKRNTTKTRNGIIAGLILTFIDLVNIPSKMIEGCGNDIIAVLIVAIFALVLWDYIKSAIASVKEFKTEMAVCVLIYVAFCFMLGSLTCYKIIGTSLIALKILFHIGFQLYRNIKEKQNKGMDDSAVSQVIDFFDFLYDDNDYRGMILFDEKATKKELLNRDGLVNQIVNSIECKNQNHSHVIGIMGPWGCGKTSLVKRVIDTLQRNPKKYITIDEFDAWMYGSEDGLIEGIYLCLCHKLGIKLNYFKRRELLNSIKSLVCDSTKMPSSMWDWIFNDDNAMIIRKLQKEISDVLINQDKQVVFVIDNLDRLSGDKVIFLLRIISSVFDIPGIAFLLLYDDERIAEILGTSDGVNKKYIEKVVNQEIRVPFISDSNKNRLVNKSFDKLISVYCDVKEIDSCDVIKGYISDEISNLRELKRYYNSVFIQTFKYDNKLNKRDLLAINTVRFFNEECYESIRNKRDFLLGRYRNSMFLNRNHDYEKEQIDSLEEFLNEYKSCNRVVRTLFPLLDELFPEGIIRCGNDDADAQKKGRICSRECFDLYYSYESNRFNDNRSEIEELVKLLRTKEDTNKNAKISELLENLEITNYQEWIWTFRLFETEILEVSDEESRRVIASEILTRVEKDNINDAMVVVDMMNIALELATMEDTVEKILKNKAVTRNICFLYKFIRECGYNNRNGSTYSLLEKKATMIMESCCAQIISEHADVFDLVGDAEENLGIIKDYCNSHRKDMKGYISEILNTDNVYKLLAYCIDSRLCSSDTKRFYENQFNNSLYQELVPNDEVVNELVKSNPPRDKAQEVVVQLCNNRDDKVETTFRITPAIA